MKNLINSILCIFLSLALAFGGIVYADFAIKKDGYSGNENFIEIEDEKITVCFFGENYSFDISKIIKNLEKVHTRKLDFYC